MTTLQKEEATTSAKIGLSADIAAGLTILSALPYELGELGVIVPPEVKGYVVGAALFATVALRIWKRWMELLAAR